MSSFISIRLPRLFNNEHYQFMSDFDTLVVKYNPEQLGITESYSNFKSALDQEGLFLKAELGSLKTRNVGVADLGRDHTWSAMRGRVDATLLSPFETERESARALMRVIDLYGNIRQMNYNAETAAITNLVADLQSASNAGYMMSVGIESWVEELKKQNETFKQLIDDRNEEYSGRNSGGVCAVRLVVDPAFQAIVKRLEAMILLGIASDQVDPFVKELNEKARYYEQVINKRDGKKQKKETSAEES